MFSGVDIDMDMNKLTQKSQEAFYEAQNIAVRHGHQEVDAENLALALLRQENGLIPRLFDKMNVPVESLANAVENPLTTAAILRSCPEARTASSISLLCSPRRSTRT